MSAFFKTLFGDLHNLALVLGIVGVIALLVHFGHAPEAGYAMPVLLLAGAGWFARK